MDREESSPGASPGENLDNENDAFRSGPIDETRINHGTPFRGRRLEDRAVELLGGVLLSRAHSLFFKAAREKYGEDTAIEDAVRRKPDANPAQVNNGERSAREKAAQKKSSKLFAQGEEVLEEAGTLCLGGRYSVSDKLMAKYWFVRGFRADIDHDGNNAANYFEKALSLDESYSSLERVRYYSHQKGNDQEIDNAWDASPQSFYGNRAYPLSDVDSDEYDEPQASDSRRYSNLTTPSLLHHSTPLATPPRENLRSPDRIGELMNRLRKSPELTRRPSKAMLNNFKGHEDDPKVIRRS